MTAHFDYYAATPETYPGVLADACMAHPEAHDVEPRRGQNGYLEGLHGVTRDGEVLWTLLHGGRNPHPHVYASGDDAEPLARILREGWPEHRVSRVDSAFDLAGEFDPLRATLQELAARRGVHGETLAPDNANLGATYYIGAKGSAVRFRLYEKSKELAKKARSWDGIEPGLLRGEVQVRPERRDAKARAGLLSPFEVWGFSPWTREVASNLIGLSPDRIIRQPRLASNYVRSTNALRVQYGPHLLEMVKREGSPEAVWAVLFPE